MSSFTVVTVPCPHCQREFEAGVAESLNVTRMPWAREQILSGVFHQLSCTHCGRDCHVDRAFLFTDMGRGHFVMVHNTLDIEDWRRCEEETERLFIEATDLGPGAARNVGPRFTVRVVFGLRGLVDKLRIWDAGLDDGVVEALKLELFAATTELRTRGEVLLGVVAVDDRQGRLEIEATSIDKSFPPSLYGASLARYRELAAARSELEEKFPGLFFRPFVNWRRLAHERVTPAV